MGIGRDSRHKHRKTGGRVNIHQKKRKFEMGRPSAHTRMGAERIRHVRTRGGNKKFRALRLDVGNFSWGTENITRKCRLMDVVYNASNNELVRTKTLVKNAIVQVEATPFKQWFQKHYGQEIGRKKGAKRSSQIHEAKLNTNMTMNRGDRCRLKRQKDHGGVDPILDEQFANGRLFAAISSRPGQSGRCDGYILEGEELVFYKKQMEKKKKR